MHKLKGLKDLHLSFEKCGSEVLEHYKGYFSVDPSTYYCFPKGTNLKLVGILYQGKSAAVRLQVDFCKNNTDPSNGPKKKNCFSR